MASTPEGPVREPAFRRVQFLFAHRPMFRYSDPMPFRLYPLRMQLRAAIGVLVLGLCAIEACAQQPAPTQNPPDAPSSTTRQAPSAPVKMVETLNQKSVFFPDLATSKGPLSPAQKFKLFANNSIALSTIFYSAAGAGISQATNSPDGYGQGGEGYGKRFGANMARSASNQFFGTFILASLLHEDPRFFPQANPTFGGSIKYSIQRVFVTRSDSGKDTANISGLLGPVFGEALANSYYPDQNRSVGETAERYGWDIAGRIGGNMFKNYWPVFFKRLRGK